MGRAVIVSQYAAAARRIGKVCRTAGLAPVLMVCARTPLGAGRAFCELSGQARAVVSATPRNLPVVVVDQSADVARFVRAVDADLVVVRGFPWLLRPDTWEGCRYGGINLHPSALPRDRGPAPVHHAVLRGDRVVTVSAHRLDVDLDSGPVLATADADIAELDDGAAIWSAVDSAADQALALALTALAEGISGLAQDDAHATWAQSPGLDAYRLTAGDTTEEARTKIRASTLGAVPDPGAHITVDGQVRAVSALHTEPTDLAYPFTCTDGTIWLEPASPGSRGEGRAR